MTSFSLIIGGPRLFSQRNPLLVSMINMYCLDSRLGLEYYDCSVSTMCGSICPSCISCSDSTHVDHIPSYVLAISSKLALLSSLVLRHTSEVMALSRKATALLVCDIQDCFKSTIYKFGAMSATSARMIRFAKVALDAVCAKMELLSGHPQLFQIPVFVTEQNPKGWWSCHQRLMTPRLWSGIE